MGLWVMVKTYSSGPINRFFLTPFFHLIPMNDRNNIDWNLKVSNLIVHNSWDNIKLTTVVDGNIIRKICRIPLPLQESRTS